MMRKFVCVVIVVFLTAISCANGEPSSKEYEIAAPKVIVSNTVPCLGEEVQFYYQSDISGVPLWDFGDGSTSDDVVTKHVYMEEQVYTVTLTLSDGTGGKAIVHTTVEVAGKSLIVELKRLATNPSEVWFSAHRANTYDGKKVSNTPENSLETLKKAIDAGANFAEIDIRTTSDGHFVIMHDATLNRTTNASGNVNDKTLAQLKTFKLRADNGTLTNCTIPTLTEMLLAGRGKIYFDLDLKDVKNMRKLIRLVDSLSMTDRVMYYVSTKKDVASEIINEQPRSVIFPWVSTATDVDYWAAKPYSSVAHVDYQVSGAAAVIAYAHQNGLATFANSLWSAGDDALLQNNFSYIDMMKNMHVRIIQTDYTEKIKEYLH